MTSYVAGQKGRNKPFYDEYSFRKEYMSVKNLLEKHSYLDLSYVYGTLTKDKQSLGKMYEKGRSDAEKLLRWRI